MQLPRWVRPAGFGALALLVLLAWMQAGAQGRLGPWVIGGGIAALALCVAVDRLAPRPLAVLPAVLVPAAVGVLTCADSGSIGWFVLVGFGGLIAVELPFLLGIVGWLAAIGVVVGLLFADPHDAWPNWVAGITVVFWVCWAGRHRIELLERVHRAEAAAAAASRIAERQRLAGDLHDIVAHTLAVTVLHLGGARLALTHEPAEAETGIAEAERLARHSMTEMRRVIRVLADPETDADTDALAAPRPKADGLPALFEEYRSAGLDLSAQVDGELTAVSGTTGLVLYRLVQEALANASRHAPGRPVQVKVQVNGDGATEVTVTNPYADRDGRWSRGMGLQAMTDRVRMVGGQCAAGPDDRRWVVRAELPA